MCINRKTSREAVLISIQQHEKCPNVISGDSNGILIALGNQGLCLNVNSQTQDDDLSNTTLVTNLPAPPSIARSAHDSQIHCLDEFTVEEEGRDRRETLGKHISNL